MMTTSEDPCESIYCENGGLCIKDGEIGLCFCMPGYSGDRCDITGNLILHYECVYIHHIYSI